MRNALWILVAVAGCGVGGVGDPIGGDGDGDGDGGGVEPPVNVDCDAISGRPGPGETFYEDNPTYVDDREIAWGLASPSVLGIDAGALEAATDRLARSPALLSLLVIRDGTLAFERYFNNSGEHDSNNVHSASKSMLGTLAGIAVADGTLDLDAPVAEVLPEYGADPRIRIGHLLDMATGLEWTEDETEYEIEDQPDWIAAILEKPVVGTPGGTFNYSTGNTHVMSAVLERVTGESTCVFAHERLFGPLGITAEHWGRDPTGVYSGGYNLYLTPRELARFGLLIARGGMWDGQRLVDAGWVSRAIQPQIDAGDGYGYGTLFWTREIGGESVAIAWGYGGQFIYIAPALDLIAVMTADTATDHPELEGEAFMAELIAATEP